MAKNESLKKAVAEIKFRFDLTQKKISSRLGVRETYFSDLIAGRYPLTAEMKDKIWNEFQVKIDPEPEDNSGALKEMKAYGGDPSTEKTVMLPLVPIGAGAALPGDDQSGVMPYDCEMYAVPEFTAVGAKYLIRVHGDSMMPVYQDGDLLACRMIDELLFVQPGRIYVLDTNQGQLVKMIMEDKEHPDMLTCHSLNTEKFADFQIPKSAIRSFSIVVGVVSIRTE